MKYDVCVVGGGASGMMAAISAAEAGATVIIIEKNSLLGKKLSITGGGRCNIYNAQDDLRTLLGFYGDAEKFLYSAYTTFGVAETKQFFDSIGLPTKTQAKNRAFPESEKASDVVDVMVARLRELKVEIQRGTTIMDIVKTNEVISEVITNNGPVESDTYVLSTGGVAYPETGSTGDGFNWLSELGHNVQSPTPNITPLIAEQKWEEKLSGVRVENTQTDFWLGQKKQFSTQGDVLFTHFGLSGPSILNASQRVSELLQDGEQVVARVDCYPGRTDEELHSELIQLFEENPAKQLKQVLKFIITPKLISYLQDTADYIDFTKKTSEVSKDTRTMLVNLIKHFEVTIKDLMGLDKAVVADGGLSLTELNTRTMQSLIVPNLYVTGDLLHINRPTGGYSLQLAWTTGYIAGKSAATV